MQQEQQVEHPNYYGILPAKVRYAKISMSAKVLYTELSALCQKEGYCYSTNEYFANLYDVTHKSISNWIAELVEIGAIVSVVEKNYKRRIYLQEAYQYKPQENKAEGVGKKSNTGVGKDLPYNNTSNNNTSIISSSMQNQEDDDNECNEFIKTVISRSEKELSPKDIKRLRIGFSKNRQEFQRILNSSNETIRNPLSYFRSCLQSKEMSKDFPDMLKDITDKLSANKPKEQP